MRRTTLLALLCSRLARASPDMLSIITGYENFSALTAAPAKVLIAHCAEWSPHCRLLLPELELAAGTLAARGVSLAAVDRGYADDHAVPIATMEWYEDGRPHPFTGTRTAAGIVQWVLTKLPLEIDGSHATPDASRKDELRI